MNSKVAYATLLFIGCKEKKINLVVVCKKKKIVKEKREKNTFYYFVR